MEVEALAVGVTSWAVEGALTLADILAALQGQPTGAAQPVRTTPEGGLDLRAILAGAQVDQQRSPYERTMRPGETRSVGDVQDMLAEVILAAGGAVVPGVGPRAAARRSPGGRVAPGVGEPEYLYHGTNTERAFDIAREGKLRTFKPSYGTDQSVWPDGSIARRAYFTPKQETTASFFPEGKPAVLRVKRTDQFKRESTGDVYTEKPVRAKDLEILMPDGSWKSLIDAMKD